MSLKFNEGVFHLFRLLMLPPVGSKIFIPTLDEDGRIAAPFTGNGMLVSGIANQESAWTRYEQGRDKWGNEKDRVELVVWPQLQAIKPVDKFHYAFALPPVTDGASPIIGEDVMRDYFVSSGNKRREAPLHLMCLESMWSALFPGGYMGAVLPARWVGTHMKYNKWWNEKTATVARIALPPNAVSRWILNHDDMMSVKLESPSQLTEYCKGYKTTNVYTGKWMLFIFHKPVEVERSARSNKLFFASVRHSTFVKSLSGLHSEHTEAVASAFRKHDWHRFSIRPWIKFLKESSGQYIIGEYESPEILRSPKETRTLKFSDKNLPSFKQCQTVEEIMKDPFAAHIKLGPPVKVYAYSPQAQAILHEVRLASGYIENYQKGASEVEKKDEKPQDVFINRVRERSFAENRDWLLKTLQEAGLNPYLTDNDARRLEKGERWLNIQLTPFVRTIKVPQEAVEGSDPDDKDSKSTALVVRDQVSTGNNTEPENGDEPHRVEEAKWETLYDDVCMKAVFPEIYNLWESRAKMMRMHDLEIRVGGKKQCVTFDFQFKDIVDQACKQSVLNGNVMGLGKTREMLFLALLLGVKHTLIVLPTKLVSVWQDEIETTIANYVRIVRRNWQGKLMSADYQVIEWAAQCHREKLATFNIISFEKLASIPRDALFLRCPKCKFIACSPLGIGNQICPRCNHGCTQKAKEQNRKEKRFKFTDKITREVVDNRVSTGNKILMQQLDHQHKKMKEVVTQVKVQKPGGEIEIENVVRQEERKPHLRWTFSHLLRGLGWKLILVDEANYIKNPQAQRSLSQNKLTARHRVTATGTPVSGYPRSIANLLNWTFRREVFPDYRNLGGQANGVRKFERKFGTYLQREGQAPKLLPKINNPELFQTELAPLMKRHTRYEPEVAKCIPPKHALMDAEIVPMDPEHRKYYMLWLEKFAEWWKLKREEVDKQEDAAVNNDLLVKLSYLINVSSIPHFMLDKALKITGDAALWAQQIGPYTGPKTSKFTRCTQLVEKNIEQQKKTIVFCWRVANIALGRAWCKTRMIQNPETGKPEPNPIHSIWVDGSVPNEIKAGMNRSERSIRIDKFRYQDYPVLWAGTKCMAEGYNIPEASRGIFLDYTWEPNDWLQAIARMLRPAQKDTVKGIFLCHEGTVDEYIAALNLLKQKSSSEGVDYEAFDDFNSGMIPDFGQYANAIVDGEEKEFKRRMWTAVEEMKKRLEEGVDDDEEA